MVQLRPTTRMFEDEFDWALLATTQPSLPIPAPFGTFLAQTLILALDGSVAAARVHVQRQ